MDFNDENWIVISKKCPYCGKRLFDRLTPASGVIEIKCPKCKRACVVDLSRCGKNIKLRRVG